MSGFYWIRVWSFVAFGACQVGGCGAFASAIRSIFAILWGSSRRSAHADFTLRARSALSRTWTSAHLAGRGTEASSKGPMERGETIEAPGIGDVGDGTIPAQRIC